MERLLVSACLLGEAVRYDGRPAPWQPSAVWRQWQAEGRLLPFCAECAAGFSVPRPSAEQCLTETGLRVLENTGGDVTDLFRLGAYRTLEFVRQHRLQLAILKENSPSCGVNFIYDGTFQGQKKAGMGLVTLLLREHGVQVFSENELDKVQQVLTDLEGSLPDLTPNIPL